MVVAQRFRVSTGSPRIAWNEAIERCLAVAPQLPTESVPLCEAVGRVLAQDLDFPAHLPPFDLATMDGYAIAGDAPESARFEVRGESRAGAPRQASGSAAACAISTGAVVPTGLDTVVPWEDVVRDGDTIVLKRPARRGQHVRRAGEDALGGARALNRGTRLVERHVALLAALELWRVHVARRPRVAILCTGDELRDPGSPPAAGTVVDSNGPLLAVLVARASGKASVLRVPDRLDALELALRSAIAEHDVVVTVGGAAQGAHDHVHAAWRMLSASTVFRGVSIKPGKPVALGAVRTATRDVVLFAIPGNPGSAFVTFTLFVMPALRAMQGDRQPVAPRWLLPTTAPLGGLMDRTSVVYGRIEPADEGPRFVPAPQASSGSVPGLASAEALGLLAPGTAVAVGERIPVVRTEDA